MADMGYKEAAKIRESGLLNEVSKKLVAGGGVRESFKGAFKESVKARALGVKETFDPMNLGKKLTFGSPLGAALVGSLTGRSKEDMEYFTGFKAKKVKEPKKPKKLVGTESSKELIENLRNAFMENMNYEKAVRDVRVDNSDKVEEQKEKRHKEVLSVLDTIFSTSGEEVSKEKDSGGILSKMLGAAKLLRGRGKGAAATVASSSAGTASKIVIGSGLGLTALLVKAEAGSYDTVFGDQTGKTTPKPLTQMTLKEVDEFQSRKGLKSSAVGKYQIMRETLIEAKKKLKLKDSDVFDEKLQDRIFNEFLISTKAGREKLNAYLTGKTDDSQKSIEEAQLQLAQEFAGVPVPFDVVNNKGKLVKAGESYYGGQGENRSGMLPTTVEETQQRLREQRDLNSGKLKPEDAQTKSIAIGDSLAGGMISVNKIPGTAEVGAGPKKVFGMLQEYTKNNDIKGKNVFLGTGMPNVPSEADYVQKQIDLIKEKGGNPIVLGTGPGTERKPTTGQNEKLSAMAEKSGAKFTGPLEDIFPGMRKSDPTMGLHPTPSQYKQLYKKYSPGASNENMSPKIPAQKVSSTSNLNFDLMNELDHSSSFVLVNNNLMNINKKGDKTLNIISNSGKSSDSILMQKQRA